MQSITIATKHTFENPKTNTAVVAVYVLIVGGTVLTELATEEFFVLGGVGVGRRIEY